MSISSNLKKAVEEHNLADIRGCLWSCILVDPNMTTKFKESLEYVLSNGFTESDLYEADDGEIFDATPTQENFNELSGLLRSNFSEKKLKALKNIGMILYPPKAENSEQTNNNESHENGRNPQQKTNVGPEIGGAVIGATAGAIIGQIAIGKTAAVIGGFVFGGIIGVAIGAILGGSFSKKE